MAVAYNDPKDLDFGHYSALVRKVVKKDKIIPFDDEIDQKKEKQKNDEVKNSKKKAEREEDEDPDKESSAAENSSAEEETPVQKPEKVAQWYNFTKH